MNDSVRDQWETIRNRWWIVVVGAVFLAVIARLDSILVPFVNFDSTNYLTTTWTLFESDFTGLGLRRPPLIAVPIRVLTMVFDPMDANRFLAITFGMSIFVPFYLLYRRVAVPWIAAVVAGWFTLFSANAGMINWGYISFLGIFLYYLAVYQTLRVADTHSRRDVWLLAVVYASVFYAHQITAVYLVATVGTFFVIEAVRNRDSLRDQLQYPLAGVLATALAAPVLPIYYRLVTASTSSGGASVPADVVLWRIGDQIFTFALRATPGPAVSTLLIAVPVVVALYGLSKLPPEEIGMSVAVGAIVVPSLTVLLHSAAPRMLYFLPPVAGLWIASAVSHWLYESEGEPTPPVVDRLPVGVDVGHARAVVAVLMVVVLLGNAVVYTGTAWNAHKYNQGLSDDQLDSLDWIEEHTPRNATFATSHKSLGWAIEGYTRRNAFEPQGQKTYMKRFVFPEQRRQAFVQDRIFSRHVAVDNGNVRASFTGPYASHGNPAIGLDTGNYRTMISLVDDGSYLKLRTDDGIVTRTLSSAADKDTTVTRRGDTVTVEVDYRWEDLTIRKSVDLSRGTSSVEVGFRVTRSEDVAVESFEVEFHYSRALQPTSLSQPETGVEVTQPNGFGAPVRTHVRGSGTAQYLVDATANATDGLEASVPGPNGSLTVSLDDGRTDASEPLAVHYVPAVLERNGIDYVAVLEEVNSRFEANYDAETLEWFRDSPYYRRVYERDGVVLFEVDPSQFPHPPSGIEANGTDPDIERPASIETVEVDP